MSFENETIISPKTNKYFSVVVPVDNEIKTDLGSKIQPKDLVFETQKDTLLFLKKHKNSRFKLFNNYEDAFNFSLENSFQEDFSFNNQDGDSLNSIPEVESFNSNFKSPANTDLAKFRKMIEKDDLVSIKTLISNPRYLINSCETPVILMEGPRYNPFHIACKTNKFNILKFLLNCLKDKDYMKTLFYLDDDIQIQERISHLVDLYINTPDKALHDTPLHFACKFGSYECIELLLSEPCCLREMKNKNDKVPFDVICDRLSNDSLKERIILLFESKYFIPIIRENETVKIGKPELFLKISPKISAFAGPMIKSLANDFYDKLTNPRLRSKEEVAIRLSDDSKGIERIARVFCKQNSINWKEYWSFLDDYIDLASHEGLKQLENYLQKINQNYDRIEKDFAMIELINKLENLVVDNNSDEEDEVYYTAPSSLKENTIFIKGDKISDVDFDVALTIQDVEIDELEFPFVTRWLEIVFDHIKENKRTKYTVALSVPNLNLSSLSFTSNNGDSFIQNESVYLKHLKSSSLLIN